MTPYGPDASSQPQRSTPPLDELVAGLEPGRVYPRPLPADLAGWYCYVTGAGHSIVVIPENQLRAGEAAADLAVPAPVRTVLRCGWRVQNGWIVSDVPYDDDLGVVVEDDDEEL